MYRQFIFLCCCLCLAGLTAPAASGELPRTDRYGDPLPQGAVFRIGTTRFRTVSTLIPIHSPFQHLLFSPDGKFLLSSAENEQDVCLWETATGREARRFAGQYQNVPAFALSADGKFVAASDGDKIHVYDTATGKNHRRIDFRPTILAPSLALAFSADGKALVVRHWDALQEDRNGISRWDIATGKRIGSWKMGADVPLALSADTRLLASMRARDRCISLWETASGKKLREWKVTGKVLLEKRCLIFSPDGSRLVTAGTNSMIHEYQTAAGKEVRSWKGRRPRENDMNGGREKLLTENIVIGSLAFAQNGKILASVDDDSNVLYLWDWKTGRELRRFPGVSGPVAFSPDGKIVAAGGKDHRIRLWEAATGRDLCPFPNPGAISNLNFAPDGRVLALGSEEPQVRLLDASSGRLLKRYPDYRSLSFSPDGRSFLVQRRDESYCLVDARTGKERFALDGDFLGWVPASKHLLTFTDGSVCVWHTATGKKVRHFGLPAGKDHFVRVIASSDAGMVVALDQGDAVIRLFALVLAKELSRLGIINDMNYVAERGNQNISETCFFLPKFSPNGAMLLAGIDAHSFGLWDVATGKWSLRFPCGQFLPYRSTFSPNGDQLSLLDTGGDPCLVDAATGRLRHRLAWKGGDLTWILSSVNRAFSADGRLLAAAYDAHTLMLWEVATGRPIRTWSGHGRGKLQDIVFSPDSRRLATVCTDGTALVWDVMGLSADGSLPARQLTSAEIKQAWTNLAAADAAKGHRAIWTLVADPPRALPLLRQRLHPVIGVEPRRLAKLIADLDSEDFIVRDTATRELKKLGELAQLALRAALTGKPALELRRRVQGLLDDLDSVVPPAESLRHLRAVAVLEYIDSDDSRKLLSVLAAGAPAARLTQDAKASLARLHSRRKSEPRP